MTVCTNVMEAQNAYPKGVYVILFYQTQRFSMIWALWLCGFTLVTLMGLEFVVCTYHSQRLVRSFDLESVSSCVRIKL